MKKWVYIISSFILGIVVATSGSAFAAQIKSLVGQKVTAELNVVLNGKTLTDKGAVINNKTEVPVRAIADALGGTVNLNGSTVTITTPNGSTNVNNTPTSTNPYAGYSKESLLTLRDSIQNNILNPTLEGREKILAEIEVLKTVGPNGGPADSLAAKQQQLSQYDTDIAKYQTQLDQVNEALALLD